MATTTGLSRREAIWLARHGWSVTAVDFGLGGLDDEQQAQLTELLCEVRRAAGDFS